MPERAIKGIPLLQARDKWGFHRESLRSVRPPHVAPGSRRSRKAAVGPARPQPTARSPLPARVAGRLPRLPGSPSSGRGAGCSAVAAGGRRGWSLRARNAGCSFSKSLGSVRAPSLPFLLFGGNWQGWTAQLLRGYTSPAGKIRLFQDLSPVP